MERNDTSGEVAPFHVVPAVRHDQVRQALLEGRQHVAIRDVRAVALPALRHRIGRSFEAEAEDLSADALVQKILAEVPEAEGRVQQELRS